MSLAVISWKGLRTSLALAALLMMGSAPALSQDMEGCEDHPAVSRYPDTVLAWCEMHNFLPFEVPLGPVTGYRTIGEKEAVEGRVVRNLYIYRGTERSQAEIWENYRQALRDGGFDIIGEGMTPTSQRSGEIGGRTWQEVYFIDNKWTLEGPVAMFAAGTSTSGGSGAVIGRKERAEDVIYAIVNVEHHRDGEIGVLVDIIETKAAETGLVTADAEAMGRDLEEKGRTILHGLFFDHDEATLTDESLPALAEIAKVLAADPAKSFYIVGHTDSTGTYAYNMKLSADRAEAVRQALLQRHGIDSERLQAAGIGPLSPVFANSSEGGRADNRRVELVER